MNYLQTFYPKEKWVLGLDLGLEHGFFGFLGLDLGLVLGFLGSLGLGFVDP